MNTASPGRIAICGLNRKQASANAVIFIDAPGDPKERTPPLTRPPPFYPTLICHDFCPRYLRTSRRIARSSSDALCVKLNRDRPGPLAGRFFAQKDDGRLCFFGRELKPAKRHLVAKRGPTPQTTITPKTWLRKI